MKYCGGIHVVFKMMRSSKYVNDQKDCVFLDSEKIIHNTLTLHEKI